MSKEQGIRTEAGNWAIAGGVIAGLIGLITNPELIVLGLGMAGGGYILKKTDA